MQHISLVKKALLYLFLCLPFSSIYGQESLNVSLYAQFDRGEERYSGSWFYVGADGTEYALLGTKTGTAIYQIIEANQLEEVAFIPGSQTNWREITVVQDHAYVVTDVSGENHGMQVIRLDELPNQATLITTYTETFTKGHIIQKDIFSDEPYVYIPGTTATQGVQIMDISNPAIPVQIGLYNPDYYIHDCHVSGDKMYAAAFHEGVIDIVDITDKSMPTLLAQIDIPNGFVHSSSLSTDGKYLFVAPEQDGLPARIFNIEDINNPEEVATYTANPLSLVHNPYILGDFAFISHNTEGLRVVDISDPTTPVEVGFYDTWNGDSGGFNGLWSACPYAPSGKIIGGNRNDGLYIWEFNQTKAGRIYGTVLDSFTNLPIPNASIEILENEHLVYSSALGEFRTGAVPGNYTLRFSADTYFEKEVEVPIASESTENIVIKLLPITVNTASVGLNSALQFSPNPFSNELTVYNSSNNEVETLAVYNTLGVKIGRFSLKEGVSEINTEEWLDGVYFFIALSENGKVLDEWKLIKQ